MKKCKATILFGDDYGDNTTTFHCQLKLGHEGQHEEKGSMYGEKVYILIWEEIILNEHNSSKEWKENDRAKIDKTLARMPVIDDPIISEALSHLDE